MRNTLFVLAAVSVLAGMAGAADFPIDLNSASLEEIMELPIPPEEAQGIFDYREYRAYFESVYDLMKIEGIDARDLATLKPLVRIEPVTRDYFAERMSMTQRSIRSWE